MKSLFQTFSSCALLLLACAHSADEPFSSATITSKVATVYQERNPSSPVVAKVELGKELPLVRADEDWCQVKVGSTLGWIRSQHCQIPESVKRGIAMARERDRKPPSTDMADYRLVEEADYGEFDLKLIEEYHGGRAPSRVSGDFDGNGASDEALLMCEKNGLAWTIFVLMKSKSHSDTMLASEPERGGGTAIEKVVPGVYKTWCGRHPKQCGPDEAKTYRLQRPGIRVTKFEVASYVLAWDTARGVFTRYQETD